MLQRIWLIASSTFIETIRQPVFCLIIFLAGYLIGFSPCFTMFTMLQGVKLVRDMGLGSMMLGGMALAVFSASNVITQEIEKRTVLTLMAKPVGRFEFIVGKYLGIAAGLVAGMYLLAAILVLTARIGVPEAAYTKLDYYALWAELLAFFSAVFIGTAANYFFDKSFTATAILYGLATFTLCLLAVSFVDKTGQLQSITVGLDFELLKACALVAMAVLVLAAAAVAVTTRANFAVALLACVVLFMLGLVSDYLFGRPAVGEPKESEEAMVQVSNADESAAPTAAPSPRADGGDAGGKRAKRLLARVAYAAVPNLQVFWMADAVNDKKSIPFSYMARAGAYALLYAAGLLFVALSLFQEREIA